MFLCSGEPVKLECHISAGVCSAEDAAMCPGGFPEALGGMIIIKMRNGNFVKSSFQL